MKTLSCSSDVGSCLIGNDVWTFCVPNLGGDGTTKILIFDDDKEFCVYAKKKNLRFISSAQGTFNIYDYDCAFNDDEEMRNVIATLRGRYGVYHGDWLVVFVKWE